MDALRARVRPVRVLVGRADEEDVAARRVGPVALDERGRAHHVALRLGHLRAVARDHPLREELAERLLRVHQPHVRQRLHEEARVHEVQDRVLHPADVLVHRGPAREHGRVPRRLVVVRVAVAQEVPRGVDERVHRVRLAQRGLAAARARRVDPLLGGGQRRAALGLVVRDVGQQDGQLVLRHGHEPARPAVDDRDRAAPVALAREQPVAQAVVDRAVPAALAVEPLDDRVERLAVVHAVEARVRADDRAVAGVRELLLAADDPADLEAVLRGEVEVAGVVARDGHDRARAVLEQHVVGDPHGDPLAVDGVDDGAPQRHARLLAVGRSALLLLLRQHLVDVVADRVLVLRPRGEAQHVGVLGRHDEERRAEQRVRAGGEDGVVDRRVLAAERHLGPGGPADPVALHGDHVLGPLDGREVVEQAVGVVRDAEEPLLELAHLDRVSAALAAPVDHLLVGEHGRVVRAPVDRGLLAVGQAALEHAQEDPLGPAVVARLVRAELARPVDRDPPLAELALELGDRLRGRVARVLARADRVVLGGEPEGVVAHRVQDALARAAVEVGHRVADRVVLQVADVRLARGVRQHLQHVGLLGLAGDGVVGHLPRLLALPQRLPAGLDRARVVAMLGHAEREVSGSSQHAFSVRDANSRSRRAVPVHLRLAPARNNQASFVHWASEYRHGAIAQLGERVTGSHEVGGSSPPSSTVEGPLLERPFAVPRPRRRAGAPRPRAARAGRTRAPRA